MKVIVSRTPKKIITLHLEGDTLQVLAYNKMTLSQIKNFVETKRDWIAQKRGIALSDEGAAGAEDSRPNTDMAQMFCGKKCMLCGDVLSVLPTAENKCYLQRNTVYMPQKYYVAKESRLKALRAYVKKLSVQNVSEEISKFGSCVSLCPTAIEFRNLSNGWVKCTQPTEKVITLDYRVCQLPTHLQNYVIVHAFSHFTNDGHDSAFWNTVSNYLPRYRNCVNELAQYSFLKEI